MALLQSQAVTGRRKRRIRYGDIFGSQYLPQLQAAREQKQAQEKALALQEQSIVQQKDLEKAGITSREKIARESLATTKRLEDLRREQAAKSAAKNLAFQEDQAGKANLIGGVQTGATGLLAAEKLSGGELSAGLKGLFAGKAGFPAVPLGPSVAEAAAPAAAAATEATSAFPAVALGPSVAEAAGAGVGGAGAAAGAAGLEAAGVGAASGLGAEAAGVGTGAVGAGGAGVGPGAASLGSAALGLAAPLGIAAFGLSRLFGARSRRKARKEYYRLHPLSPAQQAFMQKQRKARDDRLAAESAAFDKRAEQVLADTGGGSYFYSPEQQAIVQRYYGKYPEKAPASRH